MAPLTRFALPVGRYSSFTLPLGERIDPTGVNGYYVDMSSKAEVAGWPPPWFPWPGFHRFIAHGQWGLGSYERHLRGDGEQWLDQGIACGRFLVEEQVRGGPRDGAWLEPEDYPHTHRMRGPWLSAMAQGHCASLLVRLYRETGQAVFADAAHRAIKPLSVTTADGGCQAFLGGLPVPEEYPTSPPSFVLNGALYALWGCRDVFLALQDDLAGELYQAGTTAVARNLARWDTGYWSLYDLYPHPYPNIASASYHALHINQLRAMSMIEPESEFDVYAERFAGYADSAVNRTRAYLAKVVFRLVIPRNRLLAARLPWTRRWHG